MVVGVNWLTLCQECHRAVFRRIVVPPVHFGAFFHSGYKLISYADDSTSMAVVSSPGVRVGEWCALWGMKLNPS